MKSLTISCCFIFIMLCGFTFISCSSDDDEGGNSTELKILVLDQESMEPIEDALIEVCTGYLCVNIVATGNTNSEGKCVIRLSERDMEIVETFTVYADDHRNRTVNLELLDLTQEIVVLLRVF